MDLWGSKLLQICLIFHREPEPLKEWFCSMKLRIAEALVSSQVFATQVTPDTTVVL
jgi:hypothetical protein